MKPQNAVANWNKLASINPWWTILTLDQYKDNDFNKKEFFKSGQDEIKLVMNILKELKIPFNKEMALDFGCGVGRLSQALCKYFKHCVGVDISKKMVELANKYNQNKKKCKYVVNEKYNLKQFKSNQFSFIFSSIVLQHIPPKVMFLYLDEFMRILKKDGLLFFQLPYKPTFKKLIKNILKKILPEFILNIYRRWTTSTTAHMDMNWFSSKRINKFISMRGGSLLAKIPFTIYEDTGYSSYYYIFKKI